jgi:hypothetical protein
MIIEAPIRKEHIVRTEHSAEAWLIHNGDGMISCPHQPGRLYISRKACLKRYQRAQIEAAEREWMKKEDFYFRLLAGFSVCQKCLLAKEMDKLIGAAIEEHNAISG